MGFGEFVQFEPLLDTLKALVVAAEDAVNVADVRLDRNHMTTHGIVTLPQLVDAGFDLVETKLNAFQNLINQLIRHFRHRKPRLQTMLTL